MSYYERKSRQVIKKILQAYRKPYSPKDLHEIHFKLWEAYPFVARKYHYYRVWLEEIDKALPGLRERFSDNHRRRTVEEISGQTSLFDS